MLKKVTTMLLLIALVILSASQVFASADLAPVDTAKKDQAVTLIEENLHNPSEAVEKIVNKALDGEVKGDEASYDIANKEKLREAFENIDIKSSNYNSQVLKVVKQADPEVLSDFIEEECDNLVNGLDTIQNKTPDESYVENTGNGDTKSIAIYDLGAGTEIIIEGKDEADTSKDVAGNDLFAPCAIKTATWVTDSNIAKATGDRRYTAIYNLKVAGTIKGKITVSNHYHVDKAAITLRKAEAWEYEGQTPLTVTLKGSPAMSSTKKITKPGGEIYTRAEYDITSSQKVTTTVGTSAGADVGISISGSTSTATTWEKNSTKLHKIYAAVDLIKFTSSGANVKNWGKVTYAD